MHFSRSASTAALILACCVTSEGARCEDDLFGLPESAAPEELYWEVLRLHAAELLSEEELARIQRELDVIDAHYATDRGHDDLVRRALVGALRRTYRAEPEDQNAPLHDAQQGRAYARRLHNAGVREARAYAEGTLLIAGMLGVPISKEELALIVALPAGGYLVGKVAGLTYKKAALLLRKFRAPDEVLNRAGALGIRIERVQSRAELENLIGKDAAISVDSIAKGGLARAPNFASPSIAAQHYAKHVKGVIAGPNGALRAKLGGPDLPEFRTLDDYVSAARSFHHGPPGDGVLEGVRKNGDFVRYDPDSGYFGVRSPDGTIRTFFRPDGDAATRLQYFKDQF